MNILRFSCLKFLLLVVSLVSAEAQSPAEDTSTTITLSGLPDNGSDPRVDSIKVTMTPANGAIRGKRGETVGWGFKVEWASNAGDRVSCTGSNLSGGYEHISDDPYTDVIGLWGGNQGAAVAAGQTWEQNFQVQPTAQGIGSVTIRPDAVIGAQYVGQLNLYFTVLTNNLDTPQSIGHFNVQFDVTITVDPPDPAPPVDQVITFPAIADKMVGDAPVVLTATSSRGLPVDLISLTPSVCTVEDGVLTVLAAGTCTIEASQYGDDWTNPALPVTRTFQVRKGQATVTINGSRTRSYDGTTQLMTAVTDPPGLNVLMLYNGEEVPPSAPGMYSVQAQIIDPMYEGSAQVWMSNVAPTNAAPTDIALSNNVIAELNAPGAAIGTLSTTDPDAGDTFTYSLESGALDNASFAITGNILRLAISADYETKNSYAVRITSADQNGLVTVKDFAITITDVTLPQSITFGPISLKTYGDAPFAIGATGTASGIPVTYTSTGPVTISDGTATLTGTGSVTITAHQVAGGDYTAAPDVSQTFTVQSAFTAWATANSLAPTGSSLTDDPDGDGKTNLEEFAFGTNPASTGSGVSALAYTGDFTGGGTIASTGQPKLAHESTPTGVDYRAMFIRRKDHATAGLTYQVRFSANLSTWKTSTVTPTVLADDGTYQIVTVPFINFIAGRKARFFEVTVSTNP